MKRLAITAGVFLAAASTAVRAETVTANLSLVTPYGVGLPVGAVKIVDGPNGAIFTTDLHGLPPGMHGFHIHTEGSCAPGPDKTGKVVPAGAAGGHFDPAKTGKHQGPEGAGHLGDLPVLTVAADGSAVESLAAMHLTSVGALKGHALMIHAGGDNYSDAPAPLGGGGARIACGVIQ